MVEDKTIYKSAVIQFVIILAILFMTIHFPIFNINNKSSLFKHTEIDEVDFKYEGHHDENIDNITPNTNSTVNTKHNNNNNNNKKKNITTTAIINDTIPYKRLLPIHVNKNQSFVHISKCAGSSWIKELWKIFGRDLITPRGKVGKEWSVAYQKEFNPVYETLMISFKHPRAHVWSLWSECVYGNWNHDPIPYDNSLTDEKNFEIWLEHFLIQSNDNNYNNNNNSNSTNSSSSSLLLWQPTSSNHYHCYHPSNFQSRHLTAPATIKKPHGIYKLPNNSYELQPNLDHVISILQEEIGWVAIADFFPESKCLLYYRLTQNNGLQYAKNDKIRKSITSYLDSYCHCNNNNDDEKNNYNNNNNNNNNNNKQNNNNNNKGNNKEEEDGTIYVSHHKGGHRNSSISNLPLSILEKIDALIRVDVKMYRIALSTFLSEQAWLEFMLGRRILCNEKLKKLQPELDYIGLDLINIYENELLKLRK